MSTFSPNINLESPALGADVNSWNVPVNSNFSIIDDAIAGVTTVALTSANVVLTNVQSAFKIIVFTGTLTANVSVTLTSVTGQWVFSNLTTGAFTVTIKGSSGDTGIVLRQGANSELDCATGGVMSFANALSVAGRQGDVTLSVADVSGAAPLASPTLTTPTLTSPTFNLATGGGTQTNMSSANTGFLNQFSVGNSGTASTSGTQAIVQAVIGTGADSINMEALGGASPNGVITTSSGMTGGLFIDAVAGNLVLQAAAGVVQAPTPATGDNSTSIATTAFVNAEITNNVPAATAAIAALAVGSYANAQITTTVAAPGTTSPGSVLVTFSTNSNTTTVLTGTWRFMGATQNSGDQAQLWLRII